MARKRLITKAQRQSITELKSSLLAGKTENQINNYIDNNITDLTTAKAFLKKLTKAIIHLAKYEGLIK